MAKVRVYELARDLNVDSKDLVDKLVAGGMDVKNYMSTLDDENIRKAREIFSGVVSEVIEEKRIKPTVIRRRKKKKVEKQPSIEEVSVEELEPEHVEAVEPVAEVTDRQIETEEKPASETAEESRQVEETAPTAEAESEEEAEEKTTEALEAEKRIEKSVTPKVKGKKTKKKKFDQPAKIIKRPDVVPPVAPVVEDFEEADPKTKIPEPPVAEPIGLKKEEAAPEAKKGKPARKKKDRRKKEATVEKLDAPLRHKKKEIYERADLYKGRPGKAKSKKGAGRSKEGIKKTKHTEITVPKAIKRRIKIQESVTIAEIGKAMGIKAVDIIKKLFSMGFPAAINQSIDFETASLVAYEFGYEVELDTFEEDEIIHEQEDRPEDLQTRPPVVTIMGHVDHGKTSLLDYIRNSNIIDGESGGITQHIGAYYVETKGGNVVFLDTPGHEAFTAMRARGAKVTDIIVLIVAADDGVMPQTREAVNHARAADIPIVVAVNKIDKVDADREKVKRELSDLDLAPEEWGGDTIYGYISAKTGEGVDDLLGLILLQAEMMELKGNPSKAARGTVIEAKLDKSRGPIATVLVSNGALKQGDYFICGEYHGKVRAMLNHRGERMKSAGPSVPSEVYGISGVPMAGDEFIVVKDEKTAKSIIENRKMKSKKPEVAKRGVVSLDDLFERMKEGEVKELNIIIKADVQGSLEALSDSLIKQSTEEVKVNIIHSATGTVSESDIMLASASGAIIIGFNVRANSRVSEMAEKESVDIHYYDVIYNAIKEVRLAMAGLLEPVYEEHIIGRVDIKEIFKVPKIGTVGGCYVTDGHVERNARVRLLRDDVVVFDGKISSLRRFKDDVKEVQSGYECGIGLENFNDIKPGDTFEIYYMEEMEAEL